MPGARQHLANRPENRRVASPHTQGRSSQHALTVGPPTSHRAPPSRRSIPPGSASPKNRGWLELKCYCGRTPSGLGNPGEGAPRPPPAFPVLSQRTFAKSVSVMCDAMLLCENVMELMTLYSMTAATALRADAGRRLLRLCQYWPHEENPSVAEPPPDLPLSCLSSLCMVTCANFS